MGLDGVELVMAIEEEFGVSLPDEDIVNFVTVGDTFEYLKKHLGSSPAAHCVKQRIFFKLRRALMQNYRLGRKSIKTNTKLVNIVPESELKEGWPYLSCYLKLEYPKYETPLYLFGPKLKIGTLTIGEIVTAMASLNADKIPPEQDTHDEVWVRLTKIIRNQLSVSAQEIQLHSKYVADLGVD